MTTFYIASRLENAAQVQELRDMLVAGGWQCTYDWTLHGSVRGSACAMQEVAEEELVGARDADVFVLLLPGGRGAHVELGAALASAGTEVYICSPTNEAFVLDGTTSAFYFHPKATQYTGPHENFAELLLEGHL